MPLELGLTSKQLNTAGFCGQRTTRRAPVGNRGVGKRIMGVRLDGNPPKKEPEPIAEDSGLPQRASYKTGIACNATLVNIKHIALYLSSRYIPTSALIQPHTSHKSS
jgi:hypothetical protein